MLRRIIKAYTYISFFLCGLLILTSCQTSGGSKPSSSNTTGSSSTVSTSTSTPAAPASSKPAAASSKFEGGVTNRDKVQIKAMVNLYNQAPSQDGEFWKWMQQEFNVEYIVDWIPNDTYTQKLDLVMASGDLPDVIQIKSTSTPNIIRAAKAGVFWNLGPVLGDFSKYPNFKKYVLDAGWQLTKIGGENYVIPRTRGQLDSGLIVRQDLFEKQNLKLPETIDEFAEDLKIITSNSLDNNGQKNVIGTFPAEWFEPAFGTQEYSYNAEGGLINRYLTDAYSRYVEWMRKLFSYNAIPKEFATIKGQRQEEMFLAGIVTAYYKPSWHTYRMDVDVKKVKPDAKVTVIPYLKGPNGNAHQYGLGHDAGFVISKKVSNEKMLRIVDFYHDTTNEKYFNNMKYGLEGVHFTLDNHKMPVLTEKGKKEVTNSQDQPFVYSAFNFAKVDSPLAPYDYNIKIRDIMSALQKNGIGKINPFQVLQSDTWNQQWTKIQDEFASMEAKAISGTISMENFRDYQKTLREKPEFKSAFTEFAASKKLFFGDK